jgi:hypothetical protein
MRLINARTRRLEEFFDPIPPYLILSHTWEDDEVTYTDYQNGLFEHKKGFKKIDCVCKAALELGLAYVWVDTCVIDKSNNTELTETINCMYRYYQNAARCYVYLSDVSLQTEDGKGQHVEWESAFRNSRWFKRGWTLQELLAPRIVEFYSRDQVRLGDKISLEKQIASVTGIATSALRGRPPSEFDLAERFKWAENRQTTKEEDMVYSLLGLFNVFLPLIYGETRSNAMRRLKNEIRDKESGTGEISESDSMEFHYGKAYD